MPKPIVIFGFHAILAQLDEHPEFFINVFYLDNRNDKRLNKLIQSLHQIGIKTQQRNKPQLNKLTKNQTHQGIVAEILLPNFPNQDALIIHIKQLEKSNLILILDSIQDPRNLGACLRNANAFGVDCVVINKDGSAPINALVHKAATGAINRLKIFYVTNLARTIKALKAENIWIIGLDSTAQNSIEKINLSTSSAIVVGSEGTGLRPLSKKSCDHLAMIPMHGNVESLNVSVATGIALFEANRQRGI